MGSSVDCLVGSEGRVTYVSPQSSPRSQHERLVGRDMSNRIRVTEGTLQTRTENGGKN